MCESFSKLLQSLLLQPSLPPTPVDPPLGPSPPPSPACDSDSDNDFDQVAKCHTARAAQTAAHRNAGNVSNAGRRCALSARALRDASVRERTVFHRAWEVLFLHRFAMHPSSQASDICAKLKAEARLLRWAHALPEGPEWECVSQMREALAEEGPNPALTQLAEWAQARIDKEPPHFDGDGFSDSDGLFGE